MLDAVLIDDDRLVRVSWTIAARRSGVRLKAFAAVREFAAAAQDLDRRTPIYIDSDLGDGERGEEVARSIHELGFIDINLETGLSPESFPPMPWIRRIRGKDSPWPVKT